METITKNESNTHSLPNPPTHIKTRDLFMAAESDGLLVAMASKHQVQKGKKAKSPAINWEKNPGDYKGFGDPKYGTAIRCDQIKSLNSQLVIIDLDIPKKEDDIAIETLRTTCLPIFEQTYCTETPSGGVHIYLLSKEKPKQSQPKENIDYQTNTGKYRGKYIIVDYRWDVRGTEKERYTKLFQSPEKIAIVKNSDEVLEDIMQKLIDSGHITTPKQEHINSIVELFTKYCEEGTRDKYSCAIVGFLRKQGYNPESVKEIIGKVFKNDEELEQRLNKVERTFEKPLNEIVGWKYLKKHLSPSDQEKLMDLTKSDGADIKLKILQSLSKNKEPTSKLLSDYINTELELYKNLNINKYYERTMEGQFKEIDERRLIEYCNDNFGVNSISSKRCYEVLKHITRPINKNYNLIEFTNGILNTEKRSFDTSKTEYNETPKIVLNLEWNSEAPPGRIGNTINRILDHRDHPEDKERWFRAVGHAFMGYNRLGKLTMVHGGPGTGKSTLTTMLQRIFNCSNLPTSTINANERFTLHTLIDKDINIDDDINNGMLRAIGTLNTITTGNGLEVEVKGENRTIQAGNQQIPRLFANGNTLPPVLGEGFERRLLLIHAENEMDYDEKDEMLQSDILSGKYDKDGIEWLIHHSINTYWDKINEPITTREDEARMKEDYEFKSYPLLKAIEAIFKEDYTGFQNIPVREVNMWIKKWCIWAYTNGKISKEHRKPSKNQIKKAMDHAGYDQNRIRDGDIIIRVYEDIIFKEEWETLLNPRNK
ncbi:MAG: putative ATPase [Methanobacterium sp. Maddingley MBC34]|nr:MAG: putative ATPase [Methanobacterium sp. Maddingley MBC34]